MLFGLAAAGIALTCREEVSRETERVPDPPNATGRVVRYTDRDKIGLSFSPWYERRAGAAAPESNGRPVVDLNVLSWSTAVFVMSLLTLVVVYQLGRRPRPMDVGTEIEDW